MTYALPVLLLVAATAIGFAGASRLRTAQSNYHATPWVPLVIWAILFTIGVSIWLYAT